MEVYFKNLSAEGSTEKLVEDLMVLVEDAEELVRATGANLSDQSKAELATALERVKASCHRVKKQVAAGARATDKMIRAYPYSSLGVVFGLGVLVGWLVRKR